MRRRMNPSFASALSHKGNIFGGGISSNENNNVDGK
jgi:hypothetical protein